MHLQQKKNWPSIVWMKITQYCCKSRSPPAFLVVRAGEQENARFKRSWYASYSHTTQWYKWVKYWDSERDKKEGKINKMYESRIYRNISIGHTKKVVAHIRKPIWRKVEWEKIKSSEGKIQTVDQLLHDNWQVFLCTTGTKNWNCREYKKIHQKSLQINPARVDFAKS